MTPAPPVAEIITVALVEKATADLAATRRRSDLTTTDIVNRALSLYEFVDAQLAAGSEIRVHDKAGNVSSVHLL